MDAGVTINTAISALGGSGGVVDMRSSLTGAQTMSTTVHIPANVTVLLGAATFTSTVQAFSLEGNDAKLIGLGAGNTGANEGGPITAATSIIGSSLGSSTDLVVVMIPSASRNSLENCRINRAEVAGIHIDCAGSGRDALSIVSSWMGYYHNISTTGFVADGLHIIGDINTTHQAESYRNIFEIIENWPTSATTGHGFHLDATNGECSYNTFISVHSEAGVGNTYGSDSFYINAGGPASGMPGSPTTDHESIHHSTWMSCHAGNSKNATYGFRLEAQGTAATQKGGRITNCAFINCQAEMINVAPATSTGIGGTSNGSPSGTGLTAIFLINMNCGTGATGVDYPNLGYGYFATDLSNQVASNICNVGGGLQAAGYLLSDAVGTSAVFARDSNLDISVNLVPESGYGSIAASNHANNVNKPLVLNPFGAKVGVGQTNPQFELDVLGAINATAEISTISASGNTGCLFIADTASNRGVNVTTVGGGSPYAAVYASNAANNVAEPLVLQAFGGNLGIQNTNPGYALDTTGDTNTSGVFRKGGTAGVSAGSLSSITAITASGGIVTQLTGTSDERLKTSKEYLGGLKEVEAIVPTKFYWNEKGQEHTGLSGEREFVGFSAQNVQKAIPESITNSEKSKDGKEEYLSFDDRPVLAALVNAVKTLSAGNKELQKRLEKLEA